MGNREDAIEMLNQLKDCWPKDFFQKVTHFEQGIMFVCCYLSSKEDEVIAGDIANDMEVSTARVATLLKKMEKKGLVCKYQSKKDARKTVVKITKEGEAFVKEQEEEAIMKIQRILDEIGKDELEACISTLQKIGKVQLD